MKKLKNYFSKKNIFSCKKLLFLCLLIFTYLGFIALHLFE